MNRLLQILMILAVVGGGAWWLTRNPPPEIIIEDVVAHTVPGAPNAVMVTLAIANDGGPDQLTGAHVPGARLTTLKSLMAYGLPVPGGGRAALSTEAGHVSVLGLDAPPAPGSLIPLELEFARSGTATVKARVAEAMPMAHSGVLEVPADTAPTVKLHAEPDGEGWMITLSLTNLRLARDLVDQPHTPGSGHGHLFVDGMKLGRVYETTARIGALLPGTYTVEVTLNTNDHRAYTVGGVPVSARTEIVVD